MFLVLATFAFKYFIHEYKSVAESSVPMQTKIVEPVSEVMDTPLVKMADEDIVPLIASKKVLF